jgi:hypothetical protein
MEWDRLFEALGHLKNPRILTSFREANQQQRREVPVAWWAFAHRDTLNYAAMRFLWLPVAHRVPWTVAELGATVRRVVVVAEEGRRPSLLYAFLDNG